MICTRVFRQGVIVNVLNPHTALFFFAFLPQFVNPSSGHVPLQMMTLGLLFVGMSAITDSGWAIAAGAAGHWIKSHPAVRARSAVRDRRGADRPRRDGGAYGFQ